MQPLLVLPLIAFVILLTLFVLVLRRAGRFIAATRDVERFRRQVGDLGGRVETSLGEICSRVDARSSRPARRRGSSATTSPPRSTLSARYADEARGSIRRRTAGRSATRSSRSSNEPAGPSR